MSIFTRRCCPAGVLQLVQLGICGLPAVSGLALDLALAPVDYGARPRLHLALAAHAACNLVASRGCSGSAVVITQPPAAIHGLTLVVCAPAALRQLSLRSLFSLNVRPAAMPALGMTSLGVVAMSLPSTAVAKCLRCSGQTTELSSNAMRALGGGLLCLGAATAEVSDHHKNDCRGKWLTAVVLLTSGMQVLCQALPLSCLGPVSSTLLLSFVSSLQILVLFLEDCKLLWRPPWTSLWIASRQPVK